MLYAIVLTLHSLTRWIVIVLALWALYRDYSGWFGKRPWTETDRKANVWLGIATGIQFILGILFYVLPGSVANAAMGNMGAAMQNEQVRFFVAEHSVVMFVAVMIANIASGVARRAPTDQAKFRRAAILNTVAILLILLAIPWPGLPYGRPLFRLG